MTKEVLVHIRGQQTLPGNRRPEEPIETLTTGEYYFRNQTHYLLFDEMFEGVDEPAHNMLKIRPGHMEVRKRGAVNVHMIFEKDKKNFALYQTPMGTMEMEITATGVTMRGAADWMEIEAHYALGMNGNLMADCEMKIRVTPRSQKGGTKFFGA